MANFPIERIGWTLIHFLWEGAGVAILLALALAATRKSSANLRYGLACGALTVLAFLPVATYVALAPAAEVVAPTGGAHWAFGERIVAVPPAASGYLPIFVAVWACGVILLALRLVATLAVVERMRRRHTLVGPAEWQARADALAERIGVRRKVRLLFSQKIEAPSAWGVLKAVIVLPTSIVAQLSPAQIETILLHELAHIRRHDYLVNLLQSVVETVLFYHPAIWWVSSVIRREREHCCDDLVVAALGSATPYARALLQIEECRRAMPSPVLSAKGSNLMNRIARILGAKPAPVRLSPLAALGILAIVLGGSLQVQAQTTKPKTAPKTKTSVKSLKPHGTAKAAPKSVKTVHGKLVRKGHPAVEYTVKGNKIYVRQLKSVSKPKAGQKVNVKTATSARQFEKKWGWKPVTTPLEPVTTYMIPNIDSRSLKTKTLFGQKTMAPLKVDGKTFFRFKSVPLQQFKVKGQTFYPSVPFQQFKVDGKTFSSTAPLRQYKLDGKTFYNSVPLSRSKDGKVYYQSAPLQQFKVDSRTFYPALPSSNFGTEGNRYLDLRAFTNSKDAADIFKESRTINSYAWTDMMGDSGVQLTDGKVDIDVTNARFSSIVRSLARKAKLSVVVVAGRYSDVTVVLNDTTPEKALEALCKAANATLRNEGGVYYLSPKDGATAAVNTTAYAIDWSTPGVRTAAVNLAAFRTGNRH